MKLLLIILGLGLAQTAEGITYNEYWASLSREYGYYILKSGSIQVAPWTMEENGGSRCLVITVLGRSCSICAVLGFSNGGLTWNMGLKFNNSTVIKKDITVGRICARLPPPLFLFQGCLNVYSADINDNSKDACFVVEITTGSYILLQVRFDCFRYKEGKFENHAGVAAPNSGLLTLGLTDGKPMYNFNKPNISLPTIPSFVTNWGWGKIQNTTT